MTKVFINRTEHIFIDIKLRPLIDRYEHKIQKQSIYMIYIKYMSRKSLQKVKIERRAKSTLKEPSITYSRQHNRLLLLH